ncbi:MAG: site-specific integrase [Chitinophagaceae bacterium]
MAEDLQINWDLLYIATDVKDALKSYVAHAVESQAPGAACTIFNTTKYALHKLPTPTSLRDLSFSTLESILTQLRSSGEAWKFGHVRRWYRWCSQQQIPGFDPKVAERLFRLKVPNNPTGQAVMTRDPERGPLTDHEHWLVRRAVKECKGTLSDRVSIMCLLELGSRPAQVVLLNEQDFKVLEGKDGTKYYSLDVPRLKQGTVGELERKRRRISADLGRAIEQLIDENHRLYGDWGPSMPLLLSSTDKPAEDVQVEDNTQEGSRLMRRMPRLVFKYRVQQYAHKAEIISPRTGNILQLFPYRLRYTFGTRHAEQGTPGAVLSELLDHSNIQSARVYTRSTSNLVDHLNIALGKNEQYTSIIGRFLGEISSSTENIGSHRIINGTTPTLKNLGGIGACGADFLCKLLPPLSCYICPKFQAWSDGPHEQMLRELEIYVLDLMQRTGNRSDRIPYQLSEVITAIRSLLLKLEERSKRGDNA